MTALIFDDPTLNNWFMLGLAIFLAGWFIHENWDNDKY